MNGIGLAFVVIGASLVGGAFGLIWILRDVFRSYVDHYPWPSERVDLYDQDADRTFPS